MGVDISCCGEDIDDLDRISIVAKEDDVSLIRGASKIVTEFGMRCSKRTGKDGNPLAFRPNAGDECLGQRSTSAFDRDLKPISTRSSSAASV